MLPSGVAADMPSLDNEKKERRNYVHVSDASVDRIAVRERWKARGLWQNEVNV